MFLLSLGLILFELCLTRVLSVLYYYHTAFLAISVAMLGLAIGGLWVQLAPGALRGRTGALLLATGTSMALLPPLFPVVHLDLSQLEGFLAGPFVRSFAITTLVTLLPFVGGGAVLALVFDENRGRIGRLYSADLVGAAAGALLLIPMMSGFGGPGAMFASGTLLLLSSLLLGRMPRLFVVIALLGMVGLTALQLTRDVFPIRVDVDSDDAVRVDPGFKKWNAFSRIVVLEDMGWDRGLSDRRLEELEGTLPQQKEALIDINAYAPMIEFDGDLERVAHLADVVSNVAHHLVEPGARVAVIGPGCGKDIVGALLFDPEEVVGIEINPILVDDLVRGAYREFTGDIYRHSKTRIVVGDGRSELARMDGGFDVIVANSVATWAAHSAGAMNLSEQSLFTDAALELYRSRLTERGVLSVSLWDESGHSLPLRLISTWRSTLPARPRSRLADSIAVIGNRWGESRWFTTVLLSRAPFDAGQREVLDELVEELDFTALHVPGRAGANPSFERYFEEPERFVREFEYDITPSTDDRPFFFYTLRLEDALRVREIVQRSDNVAFVSLVVSFGIVAFIVFTAIALPLFWVARVRRETVTLRPREMVYFAALGGGFMLVEIAIIQRLTIFLGHPTYSLTVGLFGILAWSGLGSRLVERWCHDAADFRWIRRVLAVLILTLVATWWWLPDGLTSGVGGGNLSSILLSFALLGLPGLLMGMPMPSGLHALGRRPGLAIPWAWAVNGAFGVLASVAAILLAVLFGFSVTFACGCGFYLLALLAWRGGDGAVDDAVSDDRTSAERSRATGSGSRAEGATRS